MQTSGINSALHLTSSRGSGVASDVPAKETLTLAPADVKELPEDDGDTNEVARTISSDDAILAAVGLEEVKAKLANLKR